MSSILVFLIVLTEIIGFNLSNLDSTNLYTFNKSSLNSSSVKLPEIDLEQINSYPVKSDSFYKPFITGRSYLVYDYGSNRTLAKQKAHKERPIASITKLMTAIVAIENMDLDQYVKISKKVNKVGGSKLWIDPGLNFKVNDLLEAMLVKSANDCAYSIAHAYDKEHGDGQFSKQMNQKADELLMYSTNFDESTGLSEKNTSSAIDLKKLANYALTKPEIREAINKTSRTIVSKEGYNYTARASNQMLSTDNDIFGIKTGYLEEAGHCFMAGSDNGSGKIISIILDAGSTTLRFSDSRKLIDWAREVYSW